MNGAQIFTLALMGLALLVALIADRVFQWPSQALSPVLSLIAMIFVAIIKALEDPPLQ